VVAKLRVAGLPILGKTNMDEFAMGSSTEHSAYGPTHNPWDLDRIPGGSGGGSAAALASYEAPLALGTDTGGSIRLPAAACGIVGLKPTYGRVSRSGLMALSWSNDHIGPMTRTVRDAALMLGVIAGPDPEDATSSRRPVPDYLAGLADGLEGLRVGLPDNYFLDGIDPAVATAVEDAARLMGMRGARLVRLRVPDPQPLVDITGLITRAESAAIHARIVKERPEDLQPVVRARLEVGLHVGAVDYLQALRLRARLARTFIGEVFDAVDVLLAPTIPEPAPPLAEITSGPVAAIIARMGRFSRFTRPFNGLGLPVLSVPCGFSAEGLPLGLQIVGRPFDEATVLRVGDAYEQAASWVTRRPPLG
jgi:aspartyl-tRNA(Asn)/glutamyl-tRNA(Gln) amidotransferase subunit A